MSAYSGCKFCGGRGCLACPGEKQKADEREAERRLNKNPMSENMASLAMLIRDAINNQLDALGCKSEKVDYTYPGQPRFAENSIYRDCPKCGGLGCVSCPEEADAEYKRQFPDGPKPIATFDMTNPAEVERARKTVGREAMEHAFGPDGGGVDEIINNLNQEGTHASQDY